MKKPSQNKITKSRTIKETIKNHPKTSLVFIDYGLHCVGCPLAEPETIEEAAQFHRLDLKEFLKDLNKAARK